MSALLLRSVPTAEGRHDVVRNLGVELFAVRERSEHALDPTVPPSRSLFVEILQGNAANQRAVRLNHLWSRRAEPGRISTIDSNSQTGYLSSYRTSRSTQAKVFFVRLLIPANPRLHREPWTTSGKFKPQCQSGNAQTENRNRNRSQIQPHSDGSVADRSRP